MPFTRQLEVYVHPLHPPLTPSQLERRALFSHHFGSSLPLPFLPRQGKPSRDPPSLPFWCPAPERLVSASGKDFAWASSLSGSGAPSTTASSPAAPGQPRSPTSSQSKLPSAAHSCTSSSFSFLASSAEYSTLRLLPGYSYTDGATYSSPPGQRLRLHYLSPADGAAKCRTQVRSDGLRFDATGNKLLIAAREHVVLISTADAALERCITCPGASIVLPHRTNPDLVAVAGQEAYQQSPYVRLYDVRIPPSSGKSSTSRSSSSSSSSMGDASPVMEMWGLRHDGWWSACWCPIEDKIVCVDRKDVLHVFSLNESIRKYTRGVRTATAESAPRGGSAALTTSSPPTGSTKSSASSGSAGLNKRSAAAADIGDHAHSGSVHENNSSVGATMRPKTPFSGTPGSGAGQVATASAARPVDAAFSNTSSVPSESWKSSSTSVNNKRSSTSPPGASSPPPAGVSSLCTSSSHNGSTTTGSPRISGSVYVHQLEGIANACTFHPSGEFLLIAQDNGSLLILSFDATSSQDPLMRGNYVEALNGLQGTSSPSSAGVTSLPLEESSSLSLPLHQGGMTCCAADPAGRFVATGGSSSERNVLVLNADTMDVVGEIGRTEGGLQAMSFSFDGQFLAWGCRDPASSSTAAGALGRGAGGDSSSYVGGRLNETSEEKQETFLTIAGTDPCEIYLQCATPAAVSAVAFHPNRYICAFATEGDTTSAAAQQPIRQGIGGTTFWTKPQHPQLQYHLGLFSFE